jgi:hypothetical protein
MTFSEHDILILLFVCVCVLITVCTWQALRLVKAARLLESCDRVLASVQKAMTGSSTDLFWQRIMDSMLSEAPVKEYVSGTPNAAVVLPRIGTSSWRTDNPTIQPQVCANCGHMCKGSKEVTKAVLGGAGVLCLECYFDGVKSGKLLVESISKFPRDPSKE